MSPNYRSFDTAFITDLRAFSKHTMRSNLQPTQMLLNIRTSRANAKHVEDVLWFLIQAQLMGGQCCDEMKMCIRIGGLRHQ